jgi:cytochrome c5
MRARVRLAASRRSATRSHGTGVAGAPKLGDKAAWAPRIKQGKVTLYNHALHGKGAMPPKGGNASLADDAVKAAVDYMVSASQ